MNSLPKFGKRAFSRACSALMLLSLLLSLSGCSQLPETEEESATPAGMESVPSTPAGTGGESSPSSGTGDGQSAGTENGQSAGTGGGQSAGTGGGLSAGTGGLFAQKQEAPLPLPDIFALPCELERSLDPITCPDGMQQVVGSLLYEGLFRLDRRMEPERVLCDSFGPDASFRTWTFVLHENAAFSDGSPLTAHDVKTSLDRARESVRYGNRLRNVERITAAGDTLTVTLYAPDAGFPALLDIPVCRETGGVPMGSGPYWFSREEGGPFLRSNPGWWQGGGQPVNQIVLLESQDAMLYRFTSGDVHLIVSNLLERETPTLTGEIAYKDAPSLRFHFLSCNVQRGPLSDAALRRALNLGVNRAGIVQGLLSGHAMPTQFPVSPASPLYPKNLEQPYNVQALSAALTELGYTADRPLVLLVNSENPFKVSAAQSIAKTCTDAGLPMEVRALPWEEYRETAAAGNWDLCYGEALLSADWNLSPLLGAEGSLNLGGWSDWRCGQYLSAFLSAQDRPAAMAELCTYLAEAVPLIPLYFGNATVLSRKGVVENLSPTAAEPFYKLSDCVIHLKAPEA